MARGDNTGLFVGGNRETHDDATERGGDRVLRISNAAAPRPPVLLLLAAYENSSPAAVPEPTCPMAELHNTDMTASCQWPSTVTLLRDSDPFSTGTLLHPGLC